jgi:hypothetical protein
MPKVKKATLYRDSAKAVATILELYLLNALQYVAHVAQKKLNHSLLCQGTPSVKYWFNSKVKVIDKYTF